MSVALYGRKRSFVVEDPSPCHPLKKIRCGSSPSPFATPYGSRGLLDSSALSIAEDEGSHSLPTNVSQWADAITSNFSGASTIDIAKSRVATLLENFEQFLNENAAETAVGNARKENGILKEKMEGVLRENSILKKAVACQHERQKALEESMKELDHLKEMVTQYKERVRVLEINNYALNMHLRQAQQSHFSFKNTNPDVF